VIGVLLVDDHALIRQGRSDLTGTAQSITPDAGPEERMFGVAAGSHPPHSLSRTCRERRLALG